MEAGRSPSAQRASAAKRLCATQVGFAYACYSVLFDATPEMLPVAIPYPSHFSKPVLQCMAGN